MKLTENDREKLMQELQAVSSGLWVEIYSELQRGGAELPIWVLVASQSVIVSAFEVIMKIIQPYLEKFQETEFSISIDEFRDGKLFHWNHVEPYEIRSGSLMHELGREAVEDSEMDSVYKTVRAARAIK